MSAFTKFVTCQNNAGLDTDSILKALFVQHTDGSIGIRTVKRTITALNTVTDRQSCSTGALVTLDQMIRESIVLDPGGKPALLLMDTTSAT